APGRIFGRIVSGPGCSATQGALATTSKNVAPVSRTVLNTLDSASAGIGRRQTLLGVRQTLKHGIRTPYQVGLESSSTMSRIVDVRSFVTAPDWSRNVPLHNNARAATSKGLSGSIVSEMIKSQDKPPYAGTFSTSPDGDYSPWPLSACELASL